MKGAQGAAVRLVTVGAEGAVEDFFLGGHGGLSARAMGAVASRRPLPAPKARVGG